jgi:hypothetical protein
MLGMGLCLASIIFADRAIIIFAGCRQVSSFSSCSYIGSSSGFRSGPAAGPDLNRRAGQPARAVAFSAASSFSVFLRLRVR